MHEGLNDGMPFTDISKDSGQQLDLLILDSLYKASLQSYYDFKTNLIFHLRVF